MQQRISDETRKQSERKVDCVECQNGSDLVAPKFNTKSRICYKYSNSSERARLLGIEGSTTLLKKYNEMQEEIKSVGRKPDFDNTTRAMRLCPFSFNHTEQDERAYEYMARSVGGFEIKLPFNNLSIGDQPAIFFDFLDLYNKAIKDYSEREKE